MRKLSIIIPFFLLFFSLQSVTAQDSRAEKILKSSKATFEAVQDFSADFSYGIASPQAREITKKGTFAYKNGMFRAVMKDQQIFCDGAKLWVYLPDDAEVSISDYDPEEGIDIESIFKLYEANAMSRYDGEETVKGQTYHKIYLAVKDPSIQYNQVKLWINKKNQMLEKAVLIDRRQTTTTYQFSDIKTNNGFGASHFRFDAATHPDVEVYDETE